MRDFAVAKVVIYVAIVVGWLCVLIGGVVLISSFGIGISGVLSAGAVALTGLIIVAISQMGLAQIATAENTHQTNVLLQTLIAQSKTNNSKPLSNPAQKFKAEPSVSTPSERQEEVEETYNGYEILLGVNGVTRRVGDKYFQGILAARQYIDQLTDGDK